LKDIETSFKHPCRSRRNVTSPFDLHLDGKQYKPSVPRMVFSPKLSRISKIKMMPSFKNEILTSIIEERNRSMVSSENQNLLENSDIETKLLELINEIMNSDIKINIYNDPIVDEESKKIVGVKEEDFNDALEGKRML
jgi:hypothetical protein